MSSAFFCGE
jgi:MerR, DNA binding